MIRKLFPVRILTENPEVIVSKQRAGGTTVYDTKTIKGTHYRITPQTPDEIFIIQMLDHRSEKFAPASGDGVIVTESALLKFR